MPISSILKKRYLTALELEWEQKKPLLKNKAIYSIYFGGGTPSLLELSELEKILTGVHDNEILQPLKTLNSCEITLEVNPEKVTRALLVSWKKLGINRLSFGVQSLHDPTLKMLGRKHSAKKSLQAIEEAHLTGFKNISIDLIYDVPKQTLSSFETTLSQAILLPITHVSLYNLTIEPNTLFFQNREKLSSLMPKPQKSLEMLNRACEVLESGSFMRYEISAFAKKGFEAKHNSVYWEGGEFLGLGPAAFSYFEGRRFQNTPNINHYFQLLQEGKSPIEFEEKLAYPENVKELLVINLRMLKGANLAKFNLPKESLAKIEELIQKGFLEKKNENLKLTPKGLLFYDLVATELI